MINSPKKLSYEYTNVKVINFIYNIFINYDLLYYQNIIVYICVCVFMLECDGLSWLETNILVTKFGPRTKNPSSAPVSDAVSELEVGLNAEDR